MPAYSSSSLDSTLHETGSSRGNSAMTTGYSVEVAPLHTRPIVTSTPINVRPVVVEPQEVPPVTGKRAADQAT
jgi:hypothetical protein